MLAIGSMEVYGLHAEQIALFLTCSYCEITLIYYLLGICAHHGWMNM